MNRKSHEDAYNLSKFADHLYNEILNGKESVTKMKLVVQIFNSVCDDIGNEACHITYDDYFVSFAKAIAGQKLTKGKASKIARYLLELKAEGFWYA